MPTIPPTITPAPAAPQRGDRTTFSARVDAFLTWLIAAVTQFGAVATNAYNNAVEATARATDAASAASSATTQAGLAANQVGLAAGQVTLATAQANAAAASAASALNAPGTSATSATSKTVAVGSVSLTVQTGKAFVVGQFVVIASTASPANYMAGQITAYNSGTGALTVNVSGMGGSGTFAAWTVAVVGAPGGGARSGANVQSISSDLTLTAGSALVQSLSATAENLCVILPNATTLSPGGALFAIENTGLNTIGIRNSAGVLETMIQPGQVGVAYLKDNSTATGSWAFGSERGGELGGILRYTATAAGTGTTAINAVIVGLSETKALLVSQYSATTIYAYVLTISGQSVSVGAANAITVASGIAGMMMMSAVNATQAFIVFMTEVNVLTVAGDVVTMGAGAATALGGTTYYTVCPVSAGKIALTSVTSSTLSMIVLTLSGTTVLAGSLATFTVSTISSSLVACALSDTEVLVAYVSSNTICITCHLKISGTVPSLETPALTMPLVAAGSAYLLGVVALSSTAALIVWLDDGVKLCAVVISRQPTKDGAGNQFFLERSFLLDLPFSTSFYTRPRVFTKMADGVFVLSTLSGIAGSDLFVALRYRGGDLSVSSQKILTNNIPIQNFARLSNTKAVLVTSTAATTPFARIMEIA